MMKDNQLMNSNCGIQALKATFKLMVLTRGLHETRDMLIRQSLNTNHNTVNNKDIFHCLVLLGIMITKVTNHVPN